MSAQPDYIHTLDLPIPETDTLDDDLQKYFVVCQDKLGIVPNVLRSYAIAPERLRSFIAMYNDRMLSNLGLSKLERELFGDPALGELMAINYRAAELSDCQRTMLDFVLKATNLPAWLEKSDRQSLRDVGFGEHGIMDIACISGFFNMTNRVSTALDRMPNPEYHAKAR